MRPVHFELPADDTARCITFYNKAFGWTFEKWDGPMPYWLITTGPDSEPGINGGLVKRMGPSPADMQPVNAYVCTTSVASVDDSLAKALSSGGTLALAKMPVPGVGWLAYVKDTEGNILGLIQMDPAAK